MVEEIDSTGYKCFEEGSEKLFRIWIKMDESKEDDLFYNGRVYRIMVKEEDLEKEIMELEEKLKDREDALPAHSVKPQQMLFIEELETSIEEKKNELAGLRKRKLSS